MPRWRFLTGQYAEALGLQPFPVQLRRQSGLVSMSTGGVLPRVSQPIAAGVEFEGSLYLFESPGWVRA